MKSLIFPAPLPKKKMRSAQNLKFFFMADSTRTLYKKKLAILLRENEAKDKVDGEENRIKGESQEQLIEEWLKQEFPIDKVKEIKKGQAGADTLLQVNDKYQSGIGSILIESKRTKNFSNTWIKKMKGDLKKVKSNFKGNNFI